MNAFSRRSFIRKGVPMVGSGLFWPVVPIDPSCNEDEVKSPGPIPLNNVLRDYKQIDPRFGHGLKLVEVCDIDAWNDKRGSILNRAKLMLGVPPQSGKNKVVYEILGEQQREGYKEVEIEFPSGSGDVINGFLLLPDGLSNKRPSKAVIAMHGTGPGAKQTIGIEPKENRCYGKELAQRGYVVLAIDVISAGKRIYRGYEPYDTDAFYNEFPNWSAMGKMLYDHKRAVDLICSLEYVDKENIGCIGHSLGGYNAFFLQAFDSRIKAGISSCGLSPMGGSVMPYQFARNDWFVHFNPVARDYIRAGFIPCDMHEILALCAPRPFFNYSAMEDTVYYPPLVRDETGDFTTWWSTVDNALNQVGQVYNLLKETKNFTRVENRSGHDFPLEVRIKAFEWLDEQLGKV